MGYYTLGPSGSRDAQHGPRPVHGERHNWPGRASMTSSATGPDSLVSLVTSENLKRVPNWDFLGNIGLSLEAAAWIRICIVLYWSKNN
jgi:hypothetical protein